MELSEALVAATAAELPSYQPIPLPAPLWLLEALLLIGFFTHVIPMNVVLAGPFLSAIFLMKGKTNKYYSRIGKTLAGSLPVFTSVAITQGIVPLLFLQLIYGPLYYSSSIFMALPWLSVIFVLLIAYYLLYIFKMNQARLAARGPWVLILASTLFAFIAYLFTSNVILMTSPEKLLSILGASSHGMNFAPTDPQLLPRLMHSIVASFAVTGLAIASFSFYYSKKDSTFANWLVKLGSGIYLWVTLLQLGVGSWFLTSLPREAMLQFMGQSKLSTMVFGLSFLLIVASLVLAAISWKSASMLAFKFNLFCVSLVLLTMIGMRHLLRVFFVQDFIKPELVPVSIQWDILVVFLVGALALVGFLIWLIRFVWRAYQNDN